MLGFNVTRTFVVLLILTVEAACVEINEGEFLNKVSKLLATEPNNPKCFSQRLEDVTCFWEQEDLSKDNVTYEFHYKLQEEVKKLCNLSEEKTEKNTSFYICKFPFVDVAFFIPVEIEVIASKTLLYNGTIEVIASKTLLYNRTIYVDQVVLLDPPTNLTVSQMGNPGQLYVQWTPPKLSHLGNSIKYEVSFSVVGESIQKVYVIEKKTECMLLNLKPQTKYSISIRAKPDGVSYDGYWSAWSEPVTELMQNDMDPLILSLSIILALIVLSLISIILITHRRMLMSKMWPLIPSPEKSFEGLFTVYKGNFQEWMGSSNNYLWWNPHFLYMEDLPVSLEILSELQNRLPSLPRKRGHHLCMENSPLFIPSRHNITDIHQQAKPSVVVDAPVDPRNGYVVLNENFVPCTTISRQSYGDQDVSDEDMPLGLLFAESNRSKALSSEEEQESSQQSSISSSRSGDPSPVAQEGLDSSPSFEYTVFDPAEELLYPKRWKSNMDPKYAYQMLSDSGISAGYSTTDGCSYTGNGLTGFYTNLSKNRVHNERLPQRPAVYPQC
ncbi:erythropoietin receptor [Protopterus annectens]|uniref:erythropoietin receptor n=1 Tax=Protopterus annectens TaxID=7888 RepID=UPI001CF9799B|nr:erythropoietin receptor [Protopterus annectens]